MQPFNSQYRGQPVLAGTLSEELDEYIQAKFYYSRSNQFIQ